MYITGIKTDVVSSSPEFTPGTIGMNHDGKVWKYVKIMNTTATVAGVAGDLVSYFKEVGHGQARVVTDVTDADGVPIGAGLLGGTIVGTLAVAEYGWIQIKGPATANQALAGTPLDGEPLVASATDKTLTRQLFAGTSPTIVANGAMVAIANDVSAKLVVCDFPY